MDMCFGFLIVMVLCFTVLASGFMVSLSMPKSRMRCVVLQVTGWAFTAFCGVYVVSPVDVLPEIVLGPIGLIDDIGAIVAAVMSARAALAAGEEGKKMAAAEEKSFLELMQEGRLQIPSAKKDDAS
jgi:uncharacterized membrane protein YkvA (DUF1232 family)